MKKIIIAAVAVAMAAVTQAASFNWATSGSATKGYIYLSDGTTKANGLAAYVFDAAVVSQADLLAGLRDGSAIGTYTSVANTSVNSSAKIGTTPFTYGEAGSGYNFYMAIMSDNEVLLTDGVNVVGQLSDASAVTFANPGTWSKVNNADASFSSSGWYSTTSVPEPTSGLLLLLGMAGLALKRKHA